MGRECPGILERLAAYVDGLLTAEERAEIEQHLGRCPPCQMCASGEQTARMVLRARAFCLRSAGDPDDVKASGKAAPLQFTLKDMNGVEVKLASFKGKVILLNFWATWCGPCRAEIPSLVELQKQYASDLVVLGFSVDDPVDKLK